MPAVFIDAVGFLGKRSDGLALAFREKIQKNTTVVVTPSSFCSLLILVKCIDFVGCLPHEGDCVFSLLCTNVLIKCIIRKWNRLKEALEMFTEHDYSLMPMLQVPSC